MRTKILIVDDVELNREILAEILKDEYEIVMAENGKQALEILAQQRNEIALMLLDLFMPEMDGFEVLEVVSRQSWGKHLAIMIISSDNTSQTESRCFELGVSDFIHRPFDARLVKRDFFVSVSEPVGAEGRGTDENADQAVSVATDAGKTTAAEPCERHRYSRYSR